MKKLLISFILITASLFFMGCNLELFDDEGLAGEAVRIQKTAQNIPKINPYSEICDDGKDNDNDGLIDCQDLNSCYATKSAPQNICKGLGNVDGLKILIVAKNLGFYASNNIKSRPDGKAYIDGNDACGSVVKECVYIEQYKNNKWVKVSLPECQNRIGAEIYNYEQNYRAVCSGIENNINVPILPNSGVVNK